jgi:hypothetical protein
MYVDRLVHRVARRGIQRFLNLSFRVDVVAARFRDEGHSVDAALLAGEGPDRQCARRHERLQKRATLTLAGGHE